MMEGGRKNQSRDHKLPSTTGAACSPGQQGHPLQGAHTMLTAALSSCCHLTVPLLNLGAQGVLGCGRMLRRLGHALTFPAVATACAFMPPASCYTLGGAAVASRLLTRRQLLPCRPAQHAVQPLQYVSGSFINLGIMCTVLPYLTPGCWRALQYWQRSLPILVSYLWTGRRARRLVRAGRHEAAQQLWQAQHEDGAQRLFDMLADIKGFYMKLGQILATKTDLLPPAYTSSLSRLMDRLHPAPWPRIQRILQHEFKQPVMQVFSHLDPFPLASATIAQVHVGRLRGNEQEWVAVKVQHSGVRRMMHADLANMRLCVELCERLRIDLGFDLGSLVREYQVAVPGETRFDLEARNMAAVQASLKRRASADLPELSQVLIPTVYPQLCTSRVLVMSLLQGVPLLHIDAMADPTHKRELMHALVMAFGVQILCDGLFHTDPHPGNLLACKDAHTGRLQIGLLDFGQMKSLTAAERVRYAQLVLALATRDNSVIRQTCRQLGLRIEKCGPDFEEIAAYILFDTRMDMAEALQGPMDPNAHEGWRTTRVPSLPRDLFMIMRVVTLLRGVLASLHVYDVSSALLWRPLALEVLAGVDWVPASLSHTTTPVASPRQQSRNHRQLAVAAHPLEECADKGIEHEVDGGSQHLPAPLKTMHAPAVHWAEQDVNSAGRSSGHGSMLSQQTAPKSFHAMNVPFNSKPTAGKAAFAGGHSSSSSQTRTSPLGPHHQVYSNPTVISSEIEPLMTGSDMQQGSGYAGEDAWLVAAGVTGQRQANPAADHSYSHVRFMPGAGSRW